MVALLAKPEIASSSVILVHLLKTINITGTESAIKSILMVATQKGYIEQICDFLQGNLVRTNSK